MNNNLYLTPEEFYYSMMHDNKATPFISTKINNNVYCCYRSINGTRTSRIIKKDDILNHKLITMEQLSEDLQLILRRNKLLKLKDKICLK